MRENLVGYLLGSLGDDDRSAVEALLRSSPEARRELALLRRALAPLAADRDEVAPPPGLAGRTLAKLADGGADLPRAPREPRPAATPRGAWWRRADLAVAATLLAIVLGALAPLVYRWQHQSGVVACQENLRQLFVALASYRDLHGDYPDLSREAPRNVAGLVVPVLADAGVLPNSFSVRCPEVGPHLGCPVTMGPLRTLPEADFQAQAPNLAVSYAFALGYRDPAGTYHAPWQPCSSTWPIVADRPPSEGSPGNSVNHGGAGQNVLFLDGHFAFVPGRTVGADDDIFLNRASRVAAGLDAQDIVLGSSAARP